MLIDVVPYCGIGAEPDLLRLRAEELAGIVDALVVVEGTHTYQGQPRERALTAARISELLHRYAPPFIDHVLVPALDAPGVRPLTRDDRQRDLGLEIYLYPEGPLRFAGAEDETFRHQQDEEYKIDPLTPTLEFLAMLPEHN